MKLAIFVALIASVYAGIEVLNVTIPPGHPQTCAAPTTCDDPLKRAVRYPAPDLSKFYQCVSTINGAATEWKAELYSCQCGTLFDFQNQKCVDPFGDAIWMPWCPNAEITNRDPLPCS